MDGPRPYKALFFFHARDRLDYRRINRTDPTTLVSFLSLFRAMMGK